MDTSDPGATDDGLAEVRAERDRHGRALTDAVMVAVPAWIERCVASRLPSGTAPDAVVSALVATATKEAIEEARPGLADAVTLVPGVDAGPTPLQIVRALVRHPTTVLAALGVPAVERGDFEQQSFPDDLYDLSPAAWADIDPALHEPGIAWGAATAHLHKRVRSGG